MAESDLSDEKAERILNRLDSFHEQIRDIKRHVRGLKQAQKKLHPEEYERAKQQVERES